MGIVEKLCLVHRDNLMSTGREETDSDHILKLSYLIMFIYPYLKTKVDYTKMLEMALVHDLVEAEIGDFSLSAQNKNPEFKKIKKQKEHEAILKYKKMLPLNLGDKIYDLFVEYEQKSSREAEIVWCLDKLEANLQANRHLDGDIRYWANCDGGEWYYHMVQLKKKEIEELDEEVLSELENAIITISKENIKKCKISI